LERREQAAKAAAAEAEVVERKRLELKEEEIEEWGHGALRTLQRLHSSGRIQPSVRERARRNRRRDDDEEE
jgi:hypothetical protein